MEGHEIGFAGHLDQDPDPTTGMDVGIDNPLTGLPPFLLGGGGDPLLAEILRGLLHITITLGERFFAVHHARIGEVSEFLDHLGADFHASSRITAVSPRDYSFSVFSGSTTGLVTS